MNHKIISSLEKANEAELQNLFTQNYGLAHNYMLQFRMGLLKTINKIKIIWQTQFDLT
jgi:hypothetical protein